MQASSTLRRTLATLACCTGVALIASPALAGDRCNAPQPGGEARACAARTQGPDALRRFVLRTQPIYDLYYPDFQRSEPVVAANAPAPAEATRVARAEARH
jgi:hypothetical protein